MSMTLERPVLSDSMAMLEVASPDFDPESKYSVDEDSDTDTSQMATEGGHLASLDKPKTKRPKAHPYSISASRLHKLSPLFPQSPLPPRTERYKEYFEYKAYLDSTLKAIKNSAAHRGISIDVTAEQLVRELPFWTRDKVVWPNILHNGEGGIVFHWVADSFNLRVERFSDARFRIQTWHSLAILRPKDDSANDTDLDPYTFLRETVPEMYDLIASKYHPDWRSFFEHSD